MRWILTAALLLCSCAHRGVEADPHASSWDVPGFPDLRLEIVEREPEAGAYGPQLAVTRGSAVVHESARLYDDDFVYPTFFRAGGRTLMLADHGSEDVYGILAWSFENGRVRDLGILEIARPEGESLFTRGAAPTARVRVRDGAYVVEFPGPLLIDPKGDGERLIARPGETVTFREIDGKLRIAP